MDFAPRPFLLTPAMRQSTPLSMLAARRRAREAGVTAAASARVLGLSERLIAHETAPGRDLAVLDAGAGDAGLLRRFGVERALAAGILPLRRAGALTLVATPVDRIARTVQDMTPPLGHVACVPAAAGDIRAGIARRSPALPLRAETRLPSRMSCRARRRDGVLPPLVAGAAVLAVAAWAMPQALLMLLAFWATLTLAAVTLLRAAGAIVQHRQAARAARGFRTRRSRARPLRDLPSIGLLVPLYHEADIARRLVVRLSALDYPREKLDILLVLETGDEVTRAALKGARLPPWIRHVTVPPARLRTKPRALNYALDMLAGEIVGIFDAEDAPAPAQLRDVATRFATAPPEVACLQGVLDFYNPRASWLTRCFTIDYASWFRLVLPGLARLGLPVPLGGTTVFLRREVLERLGRWDAHNVTEDADLGLRLARAGYRTEFLNSVTEEEATASVGAWIRQRSRWVKGYAMTWAAHMRDPVALWRDLGAKGFIAVQILFLGTLSQFLLAPLLWSFWAVPLGLPHPVVDALGWPAVVAVATVFFAAEIANLAIAALAVATPRHRWLIWWVPAMHLYWPLAAVAAWKGFAELLTRPFFWDKTAHGTHAGDDVPALAEIA